jgi:hypothetical protein
VHFSSCHNLWNDLQNDIYHNSSILPILGIKLEISATDGYIWEGIPVITELIRWAAFRKASENVKVHTSIKTVNTLLIYNVYIS